MRLYLLVLPLASMASPALSQAPAPAAPPEAIIVPPELTDPGTAEKLGRMMQAMSKAFLNLPVGEIEAAAQGRPVTPADRGRTIRDLGRLEDPNFERNIERTLADSQAGMQASMRAFAAALPAMTRAMSEMARELERATANLPSPAYPRR
ncbi:MAG TPA: hypothetical protein VMN38_08585 [Sphingomicrobium sp.]|nr:hypothetical protein [Sphingomicrobium sp.]